MKYKGIIFGRSPSEEIKKIQKIVKLPTKQRLLELNKLHLEQITKARAQAEKDVERLLDL